MFIADTLSHTVKGYSRAADRVAIGQQLITYLYGRKTDAKAWYGDWLPVCTRGVAIAKPEVHAVFNITPHQTCRSRSSFYSTP